MKVALGFVACNFSDKAIFSLLLQGQKMRMSHCFALSPNFQDKGISLVKTFTFREANVYTRWSLEGHKEMGHED